MNHEFGVILVTNAWMWRTVGLARFCRSWSLWWLNFTTNRQWCTSATPWPPRDRAVASSVG